MLSYSQQQSRQQQEKQQDCLKSDYRTVVTQDPDEEEEEEEEKLYPQQSTRSNPSTSTDEADEDNFTSHNSSSARSMSSLATTVSSQEDNNNNQYGKKLMASPSTAPQSYSGSVRIHSFESDTTDIFYDAKSSSVPSSSVNISSERASASPSPQVNRTQSPQQTVTNGEEFCFEDNHNNNPLEANGGGSFTPIYRHQQPPPPNGLPNGTAVTSSVVEQPVTAISPSETVSTITTTNDYYNNGNAFLKPTRRSIESSSRNSLDSPTITRTNTTPPAQNNTPPPATIGPPNGVYNNNSSTLSVPKKPQQQQAMQYQQSPSSSSSSLPIIYYQRSVSNSSKNNNTPKIPQQQQQQQTKQGRNSISSQISVSSSQRGGESSNPVGGGNLQRQGSHRTSFSFSRRKSLVSSNRLSSNSIHLDENSGDIERLREAIIAQRESKRRRREHMEDEKVLVGTKVSEGHVNFVTAYNMLTGIRVSVSRCNAKVDHELVDADFTAKHKLAFDIGGNELTPSAKYDFKFKDYAPWVFRHLRELFKLDPADYLISLTSKYIVSELGSPGKSGSFFYFSRDYRFIIKTIHHSEHKMLRKILKEYYYHVKNNPNTLISQFYGLHRVKLPFGRKIHFIVMNNLFPPHRDIHRTYDLKGSLLGRYLPEPESEDFSRSSKVFKDQNWLKHQEHLKLGPSKREDFINQLKVDVELLKRLNIMDYSLLIGVHDLSKGNTERIRDSTLSVFEPGQNNMSKIKVAELRKALNAASPTALNNIGDLVFDEYLKKDFKFYADSGGYQATNDNDESLNEIYYLGIIDCLTPYTFFKRVETFWKGMSHPRNAVSAVPAQEYGDRFFKFIKSVITKGNNSNDNNEITNENRMANNNSGIREPRQSIEPALPALAETDRENGATSTGTNTSEESVLRQRKIGNGNNPQS